jgi:hypothetical protein
MKLYKRTGTHPPHELEIFWFKEIESPKEKIVQVLGECLSYSTLTMNDTSTTELAEAILFKLQSSH